ncbi:MAG: hypothetical protein DHS20C18_50460 [Saprospiraceae bacterium]|nr:MAG: hypothetical protein DHS20C18_50460 [Saprospiraceae bacterium]
MNKYLFLLLSIGLFAACENPSTTTQEADVVTSSEPQSPQGSGRINAPTPAGDSYMESLLIKDYWVFEHYIPKDDTDMEAKLFNKGRWYNFNADGTYQSGHWQEQLGEGIWKYYEEDGQPKVWMDSKNDSEDSEYKLKANGEGDAMSWVGSTRYRQNGIMIKAISLMTMPTKKQFGVE